jgi:hypothetical protein
MSDSAKDLQPRIVMTDEEWVARCNREAEDRRLDLRMKEVLAERIAARQSREAGAR